MRSHKKITVILFLCLAFLPTQSHAMESSEEEFHQSTVGKKHLKNSHKKQKSHTKKGEEIQIIAEHLSGGEKQKSNEEQESTRKITEPPNAEDSLPQTKPILTPEHERIIDQNQEWWNYYNTKSSVCGIGFSNLCDKPIKFLSWLTASSALVLTGASALVSDSETKQVLVWVTFGVTAAATLLKGLDSFINTNILKNTSNQTEKAHDYLKDIYNELSEESLPPPSSRKSTLESKEAPKVIIRNQYRLNRSLNRAGKWLEEYEMRKGIVSHQ